MKPATVDMLRAHLMVASFTAMGAEAVACVALLVSPVSQATFVTVPFRLLAVAVIVSGVVAVRRFAHGAFALAMQSRHATPLSRGACAVQPAAIAVGVDCPRRWLVILHLRFTRRPFVLAEH